MRREEELIKRIMGLVSKDEDELLGLGIDDASARKLSDGIYVFNVDSLTESSDLPPKMSLRDFGRKAVIFNYSDLAAKGAKPLFFMASLTMQPWRQDKDFEDVIMGIEEGVREYGTHLTGGDIGAGREINLTGLAVGRVVYRLVPRSGSSPGDLVYTTGSFGLTWLALKHLLEGLELPEGLKREALRAVFRPIARVEEGLTISKFATSCIDSSDGLYRSLFELMRASGNGFQIDRLPIDPQIEKFLERRGIDPIEPVFYGGEEFHLIFTVSKESFTTIERELGSKGYNPIRIGRVISERGIFYRGEEVPPGGWLHFE